MSYSKRAREVTVGDRIWRDGKYWLVTASVPANHDTDRVVDQWCLHLFYRNAKATWFYPADFDLAVADRTYVPRGTP